MTGERHARGGTGDVDGTTVDDDRVASLERNIRDLQRTNLVLRGELTYGIKVPQVEGIYCVACGSEPGIPCGDTVLRPLTGAQLVDGSHQARHWAIRGLEDYLAMLAASSEGAKNRNEGRRGRPPGAAEIPRPESGSIPCPLCAAPAGTDCDSAEWHDARLWAVESINHYLR